MSESQTSAGYQSCKVSSLSSVPSAHVDPGDILNNFCIDVYAQKSNVKCLHAEQLLFSCLCSKVAVYS